MGVAVVPIEDTVVRRDFPGLPAWRFYCPQCRRCVIFMVPLRRECMDCVERRVVESAPGRGYWLYRLWLHQRLVYVGVTRNPRSRIRAHWRRWGGSLFGSVTWESCDSERDMLNREAVAIANEYPALNIDHPERGL